MREPALAVLVGPLVAIAVYCVVWALSPSADNMSVAKRQYYLTLLGATASGIIAALVWAAACGA